MAFIPVPNCVFVRMENETQAKPWSWGWWFSADDFDRTDMENLLEDIENNVLDDLRELTHSETTFFRGVAYDMASEEGERVERIFNVDGTLGGTAASIASCLVLSFYGGKRGPWNQGRIFLSGRSEAQTDADSIDPIPAAAIQQIFEDFKDGIVTPWAWSCVSRYKNNTPRAAGVYTPVHEVTVRNYLFGTQRRRIGKN